MTSPNPPQELLPCPICGSTNIGTEQIEDNSYVPCCNDCPKYSTIEKALAAWPRITPQSVDDDGLSTTSNSLAASNGGLDSAGSVDSPSVSELGEAIAAFKVALKNTTGNYGIEASRTAAFQFMHTAECQDVLKAAKLHRARSSQGDDNGK